jgi:hypothetical protein
MSEQQFETILAAVADLQVSVDAMGLDMQHVVEIISAADNPQPPEWVKGGFDGAATGDATGGTTDTEDAYVPPYPPPARDDLGAVASYVVIAAALVVFGVVVVALLYVS